MKLEVGMFVRTKTGIKQIYTIDNNKTKYKYLYKLKKQDGDGCIDCGVLCNEDILKASHTLLGNGKEPCLIEPGDIVVLINGLKKEELMLIKDLDKQKCILETHKIVSIVTKEQFESMAYKVV